MRVESLLAGCSTVIILLLDGAGDDFEDPVLRIVRGEKDDTSSS
jgi:hypothetical protein